MQEFSSFHEVPIPKSINISAPGYAVPDVTCMFDDNDSLIWNMNNVLNVEQKILTPEIIPPEPSPEDQSDYVPIPLSFLKQNVGKMMQNPDRNDTIQSSASPLLHNQSEDVNSLVYNPLDYSSSKFSTESPKHPGKKTQETKKFSYKDTAPPNIDHLEKEFNPFELLNQQKHVNEKNMKQYIKQNPSPNKIIFPKSKFIIATRPITDISSDSEYIENIQPKTSTKLNDHDHGEKNSGDTLKNYPTLPFQDIHNQKIYLGIKQKRSERFMQLQDSLNQIFKKPLYVNSCNSCNFQNCSNCNIQPPLEKSSSESSIKNKENIKPKMISVATNTELSWENFKCFKCRSDNPYDKNNNPCIVANAEYADGYQLRSNSRKSLNENIADSKILFAKQIIDENSDEDLPQCPDHLSGPYDDVPDLPQTSNAKSGITFYKNINTQQILKKNDNGASRATSEGEGITSQYTYKGARCTRCDHGPTSPTSDRVPSKGILKRTENDFSMATKRNRF